MGKAVVNLVAIFAFIVSVQSRAIDQRNPEDRECVSTGSLCIRSCEGMIHLRNYQSCRSCHEYVTCLNGTAYVFPCHHNLYYDYYNDECSHRTSTCTQCLVYANESSPSNMTARPTSPTGESDENSEEFERSARVDDVTDGLQTILPILDLVDNKTSERGDSGKPGTATVTAKGDSSIPEIDSTTKNPGINRATLTRETSDDDAKKNTKTTTINPSTRGETRQLTEDAMNTSKYTGCSTIGSKGLTDRELTTTNGGPNDGRTSTPDPHGSLNEASTLDKGTTTSSGENTDISISTSPVEERSTAPDVDQRSNTPDHQGPPDAGFTIPDRRGEDRKGPTTVVVPGVEGTNKASGTGVPSDGTTSAPISPAGRTTLKQSPGERTTNTPGTGVPEDGTISATLKPKPSRRTSMVPTEGPLERTGSPPDREIPGARTTSVPYSSSPEGRKTTGTRQQGSVDRTASSQGHPDQTTDLPDSTFTATDQIKQYTDLRTESDIRSSALTGMPPGTRGTDSTTVHVSARESPSTLGIRVETTAEFKGTAANSKQTLSHDPSAEPVTVSSAASVTSLNQQFNSTTRSRTRTKPHTVDGRSNSPNEQTTSSFASAVSSTPVVTAPFSHSMANASQKTSQKPTNLNTSTTDPSSKTSFLDVTSDTGSTSRLPPHVTSPGSLGNQTTVRSNFTTKGVSTKVSSTPGPENTTNATPTNRFGMSTSASEIGSTGQGNNKTEVDGRTTLSGRDSTTASGVDVSSRSSSASEIRSTGQGNNKTEVDGRTTLSGRDSTTASGVDVSSRSTSASEIRSTGQGNHKTEVDGRTTLSGRDSTTISDVDVSSRSSSASEIRSTGQGNNKTEVDGRTTPSAADSTTTSGVDVSSPSSSVDTKDGSPPTTAMDETNSYVTDQTTLDNTKQIDIATTKPFTEKRLEKTRSSSSPQTNGVVRSTTPGKPENDVKSESWYQLFKFIWVYFIPNES